MHTLDSVRPPRNEGDHQAALAAFRPYFDKEPEAGSWQDDHFDMIALVIGKYAEWRIPTDLLLGVTVAA
jgi:HTH-type transcriptional regulator/antitoxin HigA